MPTVIVLDISYSMSRSIGSDKNTILQLSVHAIHSFLDYLSAHSKLEFVALVVFSSNNKCLCNFTRDYSTIKEKLNTIEELDKTCIENAFQEVNNLVLNEWGINTPCHVILLTDGCAPLFNVGVTQFSFPARLHIICVCHGDDKIFVQSRSTYEELLNRFGGSVNDLHTIDPVPGTGKLVSTPPQQLDSRTVSESITHFAEKNYHEHRATLKCGGLSCDVLLFPPPEPYIEVTEHHVKRFTVSRNLEVRGFLAIADVGSPMALSRHLLIPAPIFNSSTNGEDSAAEKKNETPANNSVEMMQTDEDATDEGRQPSFCVLLHGALRKESMVALVSIADEWFALAYSRADGRKKSGLMLATLKPGTKPLPGLGDLRSLGIEELAPGMVIRPMEKRSYSQSTVTWIKHSGLQSDIQKLLRHARKLPEKTSHFYKELNRVRRAATSLGFIELLEAMALIFERECASLPENASPDCTLQLTHAAQQLRDPRSRDPGSSIGPVSTKYNLNTKI